MPLAPDRQFSFDNFISARAELIVASLKASVLGQGEIQVGLWGGPDRGKTHLLNAAADFARTQRAAVQIYDAAQLVTCDAAAFDGFDRCEVLVIDNLDHLAGDVDWEARICHLIDRCRRGDYRLLYALGDRPRQLALKLDDLRSRLQWGLLLQLPVSSDAELSEILRQRALRLGFKLSPEVIRYLLTHYARNPATQMEILRRLDGASLARQRRVTIPLVKQALAEGPDHPV